MLNITDIEDALYTWIYGVTGITTIFAHPNAPRPTGVYITIHIPSTAPQGIAESTLTAGDDDTVDIDYSNLEELLISINTYRGTAQQTASLIKDSLARVTVTDQLWAAGLGYIRATGPPEIPEEVNKQWEERSQFDVFFYTRSLDEENIETIRTVEITNELNDESYLVSLDPLPVTLQIADIAQSQSLENLVVTSGLPLADASDDFTGHLIPVDETKWDRYDTHTIYPACQNNMWRANIQGNPASCASKSLWQYSGDFVIEVDNEMDHIGDTTYGAIELRNIALTQRLYLFKMYASSTYFYRVDGYNPGQNVEAQIASVNNTVGQWRIQRVGSTTSVWYWDAAQPVWTKICDCIYFTTEDDVRVTLSAWAENNQTMNARFDNFTTVSADLILPFTP